GVRGPAPRLCRAGRLGPRRHRRLDVSLDRAGLASAAFDRTSPADGPPPRRRPGPHTALLGWRVHDIWGQHTDLIGMLSPDLPPLDWTGSLAAARRTFHVLTKSRSVSECRASLAAAACRRGCGGHGASLGATPTLRSCEQLAGP